MLTSELEEKLKSPEAFDEEMVENNAPPRLADVLSQYIDEKEMKKRRTLSEYSVSIAITAIRYLTERVPRQETA